MAGLMKSVFFKNASDSSPTALSDKNPWTLPFICAIAVAAGGIIYGAFNKKGSVEAIIKIPDQNQVDTAPKPKLDR